MMNKIIKGTGIIIMVMFLSLYLSKFNIETYENKRLLTEEAIIKYEQDLKEGKNILENNYIPEEKNYNNKPSQIGRKVSNTIESSFKKALKMLMKILNEMQ